MKHTVHDLGNQQKGATAVVTLDSQANVQLMTQSEYRNYKSGRRYRYTGGLAKRSPVRLTIPSSGRWVIVTDLGGYTGRYRVGVGVEPAPRGALPTIRQDNPARRVEVRDDVVEPPSDDIMAGQTWDVFLSHASEDKLSVAIPLRDALAVRGVRVWLDVAELRIGSSLRRRIDQGIRSSRFGLVVLSPSFFDKGWPNHELDGIVTRTNAGEQSILPIWHEVGADEVRAYSPSLADKVALSTATHEIEAIADEIAAVVIGDKAA